MTSLDSSVAMLLLNDKVQFSVIQSEAKYPFFSKFHYIHTVKTIGTHNYYVYILTNKTKTVLYTGVTNNLKDRLWFHKNPVPFSKAFTAKYKCFYLVYYEHFFEVENAITREKQIKGWSRAKKEALITEFNSSWRFLNDEV